jgi:hypothetical protein
VGVHASLAAVISVQELELDRAEARQMADAIKEVLKFYPVGLNPKNLAIINLLVVSSGIYGMRFVAWRNRLAAEARERVEHAQASTPVMQMPMQQTNAAPRPNRPPNPADIWPQSGEIHATE